MPSVEEATRLLKRAGFEVSDESLMGFGGQPVHLVTADGQFGQIGVVGATRDEAFALALAEARLLLELSYCRSTVRSNGDSSTLAQGGFPSSGGIRDGSTVHEDGDHA